MSHSIQKARALKRAVGYIRRSTEKQEKSLDDQRGEIERYAAEHGYQILRWYQDDGISGDDTERRTGFKSMHAAACRREFEAIVVWDQDRFGRFDSLEAGHWIHPLVKAGVKLVTLKGPVDWNSFAGRMMFQIQQEGKHQFLHDLSRNTARGQITNARLGFLCGQAAPYGYDRMLVDEHGNHKQRIHNGESFAKPRHWHVTLVPSDDPVKVQTAKWLFTQYATREVGLRALAEELCNRGIPGPRGEKWQIGTIREILKNEKYTGDFTWAKRREGKYHNVRAGGDSDPIQQRTDGSSKVVDNLREDWIVKPNAHPALVDRKTFARVQAKLERRRTCTTSHKAKNGDKYLLSGLVHCAHCGKPMYGVKTSRSKKGKRYEYHRYICSSYNKFGKSHGCGHHAVDQAGLLALLLIKLRDTIQAGTGREALRREVLSQLKASRTSNPAMADAIRARVAELTKEIDRGVKRALKCDDALAEILLRELAETRRERDRLAAELAEQESTKKTGSLEAEADAVLAELDELSSGLEQKDDPGTIRDVLRRMVSRIDLTFDHIPRGKRIECPMSKGTIMLRQDLNFYRLVSRGDTI